VRATPYWVGPAGVAWNLRWFIDRIGEDGAPIQAVRLVLAGLFLALWWLDGRREERKEKRQDSLDERTP
jgi:hypothetical protein